MRIEYCDETNMLYIFKADMPMSVNKAYVNIKGRRALSKEGKIYKNSVTTGLAKQLSLCTQVFEKLVIPNTPLQMELRLFFAAVENKGYPNKAKTRYKRMDVSNRVKLIEDAIFDALGVDDSAIFSLTITKQNRPEGSTSDFCDIILSRWDDGGVQTR